MSIRSNLRLLALSLALFACDDGESTATEDFGADGLFGRTDGSPDGTPGDGGPPDAAPDAGPDGAVDAEVQPDLGNETDGVVVDEGVDPDGAEPDAAEPDAAEPDGMVVEPDAGRECEDDAVRGCPDGCASGRQTCVGGAWAECEYPAETCNGVDDDCDDSIDEDFAGVGDACSAGEGACRAEGQIVCNVEGDGSQCNAVAGQPGAELCDAIDNDCDGAADEDLSQPCYEGPEGTEGVGVCAAGIARCEGGEFGACEGAIEPGVEACDGADEDCDGQVDEAEGGGVISEPCYDGPDGTQGVGICVGGVTECVAGGFGPCVGQVTPANEICDLVDNDCNGQIDDREGGCDCVPGEAAACYSGPEGTVDVGVCVAGVQLCNDDGRFGACEDEQVPGVEVCDGQDNDCDGDVDEAIAGTGLRCVDGTGACLAEGLTVCVGDAGEVRCDAVPGEPAPERCNGDDDDCDGTTDEGLALGEDCAVGVGACAAQGRNVCDANGGVVCDAAPGEPVAELCNGVDDDCDGAVDNGLGLGDACVVGVGACQREGVRQCDADGRVVCSVEPGAPGEEACDGLDNDCDGASDEDNPGGGGGCDTGNPGVCAAGVRVCANGDFVCEQAAAPAAEACDGLDNDCDGAADEGDDGPLTTACYEGPRGTEGIGACRPGRATCAGGEFGACVGQVLPSPEICDQADNDCNDVVDDVPGGECVCEAGEQQACYTGPRGTEGVGLCRAGVQTCGAGGMGFGPCEDQVLPDGEVCDGRDNDCNGVVDDAQGVGQACSAGVGACQADGRRVCDVERGQVVCDAVPGAPVAEVCDNLDNDCNGAIDDVAGLGDRCTNGQGICRRAGNTVCDVRAGELVCNAQPGPPEAEVCDGEDDDCDGTTDEDSPGVGDRCQAGVGECLALGATVCAGANGVQCNAQPGDPTPELCDGRDNDCDGQVDDNPVDVGQDCSNGVGACERGGTTFCARGNLGCNAQPGQPGEEVCNEIDDDCDGNTDEGLNCQIFRSCAHALEAGFDEDGVYFIQAGEAAPQNVYCDQTTDGGGWTLVGSTRNTTLNDQASGYYDDLRRLAPAQANAGIWDGLRPLGTRFDVRFTCRAALGAADDPMDVDLSFYDVPWYTEFTTGTDAESCFSENNGLGADSPVPARRDNVTGNFRRQTDRYGVNGFLEGEDACGDTNDFTVDFDDRGMDANQSDGTDWGEDDSARKCGASGLASGQWFVWARERPRVALLGSNARVRDVLRAQGILVEVLPYDAQLPARITTENYDTLVIGRYAFGWANMTRDLREALAVFGRNGGNVVTEYDGAAAFMTQIEQGSNIANNAPDLLDWFGGRVGHVGQRGNNTALTQLIPGDPIFSGVANPIQGGGATEFFAAIRDVDPPIVLGHEILATFPGGTNNFPNATYPAISRGRYCGGQFIAANFDWRDDPGAAGFGPLVANMVRNASTPPPADLRDFCPARQRATYAVCGNSGEDPTNFGVTGRRANTCVPNSNHQVMFVTRSGEQDLDANQVRTYLNGGGILITEYDNADEVYNLVFNANVEQAAQRSGQCDDNIMPLVQANPDNGFWQDNLYERAGGGGCGFDVGAFPGVTKLGGWTADTTSIAYRDLGEGRVWFVATDWQDGQAQTAQSNGLMRYMATHAAGGQYGRGLLQSGVRNNDPMDGVLDLGFQPCHASEYSSQVSLAEIQAACPGEVLMLACRAAGTDRLEVSAMGQRGEVLQDVGDGNNAVNTHNFVNWYYSENRSWGFAQAGGAVNRNTCDVNGPDENTRICWHTNGGNMRPGWRCGNDRGVGAGWERIVLSRDGDVPVDIIIQ